jgi:sporulation protein YlmC with PRC-barrel domain
LKVRKIYGYKVITADNHNIGEIDGVHVDIQNWRITKLDISLDMEVEKFLGLWKPRSGSLTICLPVSNVKAFGKIVVLKQTLIELIDLKECR